MPPLRDELDRAPTHVRLLNAAGTAFSDLSSLASSAVASGTAFAANTLGVPALAVRRDSPTPTADADGKMGPLTTDEYSRLRVAPGYRVGTATIAAGGVLSGEVDTTGRSLAAILMPAAWTAAELTFQVASASGGTYKDVYDDQGNEVVVQAAASRAIGLDVVAYALAPYRFLKIRSGRTASTVAQVAQADLVPIFKGG